MSDFYMYQAALLCGRCGEAVRESIDAGRIEGKSAPEDPNDEDTYDSDDYPKGPYGNDYDESDSPSHCDHCGEFLENPLTTEGAAYVIEAVRNAIREGKHGDKWRDVRRCREHEDCRDNEKLGEACLEARGVKSSYSVALGEWKPFYDLEYFPRDLVTIHFETSDDDPFQITAHVQDPLASAWADAQGSLDGGTWEEADGPGFVYDILYWRAGLLEELTAEGYDCDFSGVYEPGEEEIAIARHAGECAECDGDYRTAEKHVEAGGTPVSLAQLRLGMVMR